MSVTNLQVITDALRDINVIAETETPSAEQGSHALRKLNQMMEQWLIDGINLQYFAQTSTADNIPVPEYAEKGVTAALSIELAPTYGATVSVELAAKYDSGWGTICRKALQPPQASMAHLPRGEGQAPRNNILTDS